MPDNDIDIQHLISALQSDNFAERRDAVNALGQSGTNQAIDILLSHLEDTGTNPLIRALIAETLGDLGVKKAVEPLLRILETSGDYWLMEKTVKALRQLGESRAASILLARLEHDENMWLASKSLEELGDVSVLNSLLEIAADTDREIVRRYAAIKALGGLRDVRATDTLLSLLKASDNQIRMYTAEALGKVGNKEAVKPLIAALNDDDEMVRLKAAASLGDIGDTRALDPLIATLDDEKWNYYGQVAYALGRMHDSRVIPSLMRLLPDAREGMPESLSAAFVELGEQAVDVLLDLAQNRGRYADADIDGYVRLTAIDALGRMKNKRAVEPLIAILLDATDDEYVRSGAAQMLAEIGDERALQSLIQALQDKGIEVPDMAKEALEKFGTPEALAALEKWKENRSSKS